ncbi:MAG TPA: tripartite tricarboxylate transporter substrate binding protein [Bacillota bacterium]|nr:tripartite tricarboxylate transporter substrate binding protein [Bacillota bacterium]
MRRMKSALVLAVLFGALLVNPLGTAGKGNYPNKAIDLIVAFSPGGATDIVARALAPKLEKMWGVNINVINKAGGSGTIGTMEVVGAKPDGYKMMINVTTTGSLNPAVDPTLPYKWNELTNVCRINVNPLVFIVKGDSKWNSLKDLVADLKAGARKYSYGTAGPGGPSTFAIAQLCQDAGIDPNNLIRVVLGGGATVITDVAGGHIDLAAQNLSEVIAMTQAGKIKALAVTTDHRSSSLPDVPTTKEAGFPSVKLVGYNSVSGPANLPDEVVKAWEDAVRELCKNPEFQAALESAGATSAFLGHEEFGKWLKDYYDEGVAIALKVGLRK